MGSGEVEGLRGGKGLERLVERLRAIRDQKYVNRPYYGIIMEEDSNDWQYVY